MCAKKIYEVQVLRLVSEYLVSDADDDSLEEDIRNQLVKKYGEVGLESFEIYEICDGK